MCIYLEFESDLSFIFEGLVARKVQKTHQNSKIIFLQAIGYILALISSLILPIISMFSLFNKDTRWPFCGTYILVPLQGFFNALIFVGHKIYNYRRVHPNLSKWKTFHLLVTGKANDHILFSRISRVDVNNNNIIDVQIENEENQNEHVRFDIMEMESHVSRMDLSGNIDMNEKFEDDFQNLNGFSPEKAKKINDIEDPAFSDSDTPKRDIMLNSSFELSEDPTNSHQRPLRTDNDTMDDLSVSCTSSNLSQGQVSAGMNLSVALSQTPGISVASTTTRERWSTSLGEESNDNNDLSVSTSNVEMVAGNVQTSETKIASDNRVPTSTTTVDEE